MRESTGYREAVANCQPEEFYEELYEGPVWDPELGVVLVGTYGLARQALDSRDGAFSNAATLAPVYQPEPDVGQVFGEIFSASEVPTLVLLDGDIHRERRHRAVSALGTVPDDDETVIAGGLERLGRELEESGGAVHLADTFVAPLYRRSSLQRRTGVPADLVDELGSLLPGQAELMWGLPEPDRQRQLVGEMQRIWEICNEAIQRNQEDVLAGSYRHNLITGYLNARGELAMEDRMDVYLQANAGYVSNVHTLGNVIVRALADRDRWRQLVDDPDQVPGFVQEMLDLWSGTHGWFRMVSPEAPADLAGEEVPPGSRVIVVLGAANRAPDRSGGDPGLSFGHGAHACLGRDYSVKLITTVVRDMAERYPQLRLAGEPQRWANLAFNAYPDAEVALA